jgi:hypothetical protein
MDVFCPRVARNVKPGAGSETAAAPAAGSAARRAAAAEPRAAGAARLRDHDGARALRHPVHPVDEASEA